MRTGRNAVLPQDNKPVASAEWSTPAVSPDGPPRCRRQPMPCRQAAFTDRRDPQSRERLSLRCRSAVRRTDQPLVPHRTQCADRAHQGEARDAVHHQADGLPRWVRPIPSHPPSQAVSWWPRGRLRRRRLDVTVRPLRVRSEHLQGGLCTQEEQAPAADSQMDSGARR